MVLEAEVLNSLRNRTVDNDYSKELYAVGMMMRVLLLNRKVATLVISYFL